MRRLYYRDEQWLIYTRDAEGMTRELLLEATRCHDERMVSQGVEHLHGWGDDAVEWYGWTKDSAVAVGFPVDPIPGDDGGEKRCKSPLLRQNSAAENGG